MLLAGVVQRLLALPHAVLAPGTPHGALLLTLLARWCGSGAGAAAESGSSTAAEGEGRPVSARLRKWLNTRRGYHVS